MRENSAKSLAKIVQSWKSYTGRRLKEFLPAGNADRQLGTNSAGNAERQLGKKNNNQTADKSRAGARRSQVVWMREYWDRYIRNENHFKAAVDYIHQNPVKAGLASRPEDWPWSSAGQAPR